MNYTGKAMEYGFHNLKDDNPMLIAFFLLNLLTGLECGLQWINSVAIAISFRVMK